MDLSPKLGAAKHFVTRNEDGETDPGNASYRNIQEQFVGNYSKIEDAQKHSVAYNIMEIVLIRKVVDPNTSALWDKSGDETVNLFKTGPISPFNKSKSGNLILTIKAVMRIIV